MSIAMQEWPRRHRITVEHYYRMAEAGLFAEDARVELIDGEIIDMPPMGSRHAGRLERFGALLSAAVAGRALVRQQLPIRLSNDSEPQPADVCATFSRAAVAGGTYPAGTVIQALSTTFNAGVVEYRGEYYVLDCQLPLDNLFGTGPGQLSFTIDATHNSRYETSVTGTTFVRQDDTVLQPDWVGRFTARWAIGPALISYQLYYLSSVLAAPDATIENNPHPNIASNTTHSLSVHYDVTDAITVRGGVINFTDEDPSYPTLAHGDILGRRWFAGVTARF